MNFEYWNRQCSKNQSEVFSSPEMLWETACEYFEEAKNRVWVKANEQGRETAVPVPFSEPGFALFLGITTAHLQAIREQCSLDMKEVFIRINEIMYTQNLEGVTTGVYSSDYLRHVWRWGNKIEDGK